jgi:hypothetical protein
MTNIDTIDSPDDEHEAARNMQKTEINIKKKELCVKLVIHKKYIWKSSNIKFHENLSSGGTNCSIQTDRRKGRWINADE